MLFRHLVPKCDKNKSPLIRRPKNTHLQHHAWIRMMNGDTLKVEDSGIDPKHYIKAARAERAPRDPGPGNPKKRKGGDRKGADGRDTNPNPTKKTAQTDPPVSASPMAVSPARPALQSPARYESQHYGPARPDWPRDGKPFYAPSTTCWIVQLILASLTYVRTVSPTTPNNQPQQPKLPTNPVMIQARAKLRQFITQSSVSATQLHATPLFSPRAGLSHARATERTVV